jgi:hypothetical protein
MTDLVAEGFDRDSRLRAIAMNAIREARIAFGRGDDPFSDDDSLRMNSIYSLLHVQEKIDPAYEHFPLTNKDQSASSPALLKIADILEHLPSDKAVDQPEALPLPIKTFKTVSKQS